MLFVYFALEYYTRLRIRMSVIMRIYINQVEITVHRCMYYTIQELFFMLFILKTVYVGIPSYVISVTSEMIFFYI